MTLKHLSALFTVVCLLALVALIAQYVGSNIYFTYHIHTDWAFALFRIDKGIAATLAFTFGFLAFCASYLHSQTAQSC